MFGVWSVSSHLILPPLLKFDIAIVTKRNVFVNNFFVPFSNYV